MKYLRKRLKNLDLKITELAGYINVSRPTLYKYIDSYEASELKDIPENIIRLFDYIYNERNIGKKNIVYFILDNNFNIGSQEIEKTEEASIINDVSNYINNYSALDNKSKLIKTLIDLRSYDDLILLINDYLRLLNDKKFDSEEDELLDFKNYINKKIDN